MQGTCKKSGSGGDSVKLQVTINGIPKCFEIASGDMLVDVLRNNGYVSVKKACNTGSCGLCTVLLNGKPVPSCSLFAAKTEGKNITTIDGVQKEAEEIGKFLVAEGAEQCGYCSPGFVLTILAMKKELTNPTEEEIKNYLVGNLCRCSGYVAHLRAIKKYLGVK